MDGSSLSVSLEIVGTPLIGMSRGPAFAAGRSMPRGTNGLIELPGATRGSLDHTALDAETLTPRQLFFVTPTPNGVATSRRARSRSPPA
jgi:hypothetical protein